MNGKLIIWVESAITPISKKPQPPIGVIIKSDEALLVRLPNPRSESEKIVGNIIELKRPTDSKLIIEKRLVVLIASKMRATLHKATVVSILEGEKRRLSRAPINLPTIAPPQ